MVALTNEEIMDELRKLGITAKPDLLLSLVEYKADFTKMYFITQKNKYKVIRIIGYVIKRSCMLFKNRNLL
ncbi:MAG: hypothetical protein C4538_05785 [Nitrospiraceae bacterium]|nr:MAG: hypothetical protein C4538_05785 [Nitrospiraceae bacterium]